MVRKRSPETELRQLKAELRAVEKELAEEKAACARAMASLKLRSAETQEWKERFDKLLNRTPKELT